MRCLMIPLLGALALVSAAVAGPGTFAKLALMAGYPNLALPYIQCDAARGAALYQLGRYAEADALFASIGRAATYNRANTLAATGQYKLAVAYYDAVLFADRWDADARRNRDLVSPFVARTVGEAAGHGRIAVILEEAGVEAKAFDLEDPHAPIAPAPDRLRKPIDARTVAANRAWLETLGDAPGEYLSARLAAEYERRRAMGVPQPEEPSPW